MKTKITNKKDGALRRWFAWHPAVTVDRHVVWLEFVHRRWNPKLYFEMIDQCDPGDYCGGWEYEVVK